jgi:DNA-binding beta-propeller fold protein YncE
VIGWAGLGWSEAQAAPPAYTLFESGQVRPLAMSPDKKQVFAVNTPDNRLEVYNVTWSGGLSHKASIPVGVEPVSVAVRSATEVWVVNHLSDSVSVVYVGPDGPARVTRTLLVGDEPRDIVFAGPQKRRAFITTAHRGQNNAIDPQLTTPGVGRSDVWVFDSQNLGATLGGTPLKVVTLFSDTPRALAASPDGSKVYVAAHFSGNKTTTVHRVFVYDSSEDEIGSPPPNVDHAGRAQPDVGIIVRHDGQHWVDELGREWDDKVRFNLPDKDVFVIDANASVPKQIAGSAGFYSGVGTVLYNMIVNPVNHKVYVSNTEARNEVRFEGPGIFADTTVQGHFVENKITVIDPANGAVAPRHINPHIDFEDCCAELPNEENELSLALPQGMEITSNGATLYVAALGSDKVGVYSTAELENDMFWPDPCDQIELSGGGPTGLLLNETKKRLYVMTRFDNGISVINTQTQDEVQHVEMFNPEPESVTEGRRFLYDARLTSSRGDSACASCHVFGDMDQLAWDLGNPDGDLLAAPGPFLTFFGADIDFHPMKGPMTTQSLRGMANHGPMHWRGDRNGGLDEPTAQPDSGTFNENAAFLKFNGAFVELLGRDEELPAADMQAFADFALQLTYPPNPIRALDNSLTPDQAAGRDLFLNKPTTFDFPGCDFCHTLDDQGNAQYGVARPGFYGTSGEYVGAELVQTLKVPHLRNIYQKVGKFGLPSDPLINPELSDAFMGDQIRGFGMIHDGGIDTVFRFISAMGFTQGPFAPNGFSHDEAGLNERRQVEAFVLAFDTNMAPIVGQQITVSTANKSVTTPRVELLKARAALGECDLVVHGNVEGVDRGYLYINGKFKADKASEAPKTTIPLSLNRELTYTCMPPGSGVRAGLDRDLDGVYNRDEDDGPCN